MRKYLVLIRLGVLDSIAWRGNMIYWIIIDILGVAIVPFLWIAVVGAGEKPIEGFSIADIVTYFIGIGLIWQGVVTYPFWYLIRDIRDGLLSNDLVRPYSYFGKLFFYNIGSRMMRLAISMPFLVVILILLRRFIVLPSSWGVILMLIPALIVAFFLIFIMHFIVGTIAFWFEEGFSVSSMFMFAFGLFSGDFAPLALLPQWLNTIANVLPFQYVLNFPLQIYLGNVDPVMFTTHMMRALIWCAGLYIVYRILWARGIRQFTGVGR